MKAVCVLCGRMTTPYAMIGREAIGPKCAARAGLTPSKAPKGSRVTFTHLKPVREVFPQTLDLFESLNDE